LTSQPGAPTLPLIRMKIKKNIKGRKEH